MVVDRINMSKLVFPEGIYYDYRYVTGGDYIPSDVKATNIDNLYRGVKNSIIDVKFDTSNCTRTHYTFSESQIISIAQFDTSNVTDMSSMFRTCSSLVFIPQLDTSNVTNMSYMFYACSALTSIPQLDTSNVTNMSYMFYGCGALTSIPQLDTSNVNNIGYMFYNCSKLTTIPKLDASKVTNVSNFSGNSSNASVKHIGGFENLGMYKTVSGTNNANFVGNFPNLTKESVLNVLNGLYDRASAGYSVLTLKLHPNALARLTADDIAIATNKGWTIA